MCAHLHGRCVMRFDWLCTLYPASASAQAISCLRVAPQDGDHGVGFGGEARPVVLATSTQGLRETELRPPPDAARVGGGEWDDGGAGGAKGSVFASLVSQVFEVRPSFWFFRVGSSAETGLTDVLRGRPGFPRSSSLGHMDCRGLVDLCSVIAV